MSLHHGRGQQADPISITPKSFLAAMLSLACVFTVGLDVRPLAAMPAARVCGPAGAVPRRRDVVE